MSYQNASKILKKKIPTFWFSIFPVQRLERYKYMDRTVEIEQKSITRNRNHYTPGLSLDKSLSFIVCLISSESSRVPQSDSQNKRSRFAFSFSTEHSAIAKDGKKMNNFLSIYIPRDLSGPLFIFRPNASL